MPCPFPGMDPYLESPAFWSDFHARFLTYLSDAISDRLPPGYEARIDERLEFIRMADEAGFYCLHLAEHHQTPLNMVPVPGVFLGAAARLTRKIKMGPLVYLLPLYSPLRMIDEQPAAV